VPLLVFTAAIPCFEMKIYFSRCHPFTGAALTSINVKVYGISPFFISPTKLALTSGFKRKGRGRDNKSY
jgi:hypothetical protein